MTTYIALLRGINVSGHRLIKMSDLKTTLEGLGLSRVQTYIQSGNLLFESGEGPGSLRQRMEEGIQAAFGFDVPVVIRTLAELERVVPESPFRAEELGAGESLYVSLLADQPAPEGIDRLLASTTAGPDEYRLVDQTIYILYRQRSHKSKLSNAFFEQKLRVPATNRNWQTISRLLELARAMEA